MKTHIVFAVLLTSFFISFISLSLESVMEQSTEITAEDYWNYDDASDYWYDVFMDKIVKVVKDDEQEVVVKIYIPPSHLSSGFADRRISKKELKSDKCAKKHAAIEAIRALVNRTRSDCNVPNPQYICFEDLDRANRLIGIEFSNSDDLKNWYEANRNYVFWSELKNSLVIDDEAKRNLEPTSECR